MYRAQHFISRFREAIILSVFLIFWLLPSLAMHRGIFHNLFGKELDIFNAKILLHSSIIAFLACSISLLFGLSSAYYLAYARFRLKRFLTIMLLFPLSFPPFIIAIALLHAVNYSIPPNSFPAILCTGVVLGVSYYPIIAILSTIGFIQLNNQIEESSRLHHPDRTVFFRISIPLARPFILSGIILVLLFVTLDFGVADFFGVRTYSIEIFTRFALHDISSAVTVTYPLLLLTVFLALYEGFLVRGKSYIPSSSLLKSRYTKPSTIAPILIGLFLIISGGIPFISLLHMTGGITTFIPSISSSVHALLNSIIFALISSFAIVLFCFIWAHFVNVRKRMGTLMNCLSNLNLAIPGGLIAISLIYIWNHSVTAWVYTTILIVILSNFARFSPIAYKAVTAPLTSMDRKIKELTEITTSSYLLKMRKVFFPLSRTGLLFGFLIAFLLSFRELGATLLILPPGKETIPIRIFSLIHYGDYENVAVLCLLTVITGFVFSLAVLSLLRRSLQ
jgi:iron(III) transport system permease protein